MCNFEKNFFLFMGIVGLLLLFFFFIFRHPSWNVPINLLIQLRHHVYSRLFDFVVEHNEKRLSFFWEIFQFFKLIFKTQPISKEQLRNSKVFCTQTGILHPVWKNSTPDTSGSYTCTKIFKHILPSFHPTQYILPPSGQAFRAPTVYHTAYWVHNQ